MSFRRKPPHLVTPAYEDQGIFKTQLIKIEVQVIRKFKENNRGDIIINGFVPGDGEINLIFPGRRKHQAAALREHIRTTWQTARAAALAKDEILRVKEFRCTVYVEGSWRARFVRDDQGFETREFQLFAARWSYTDADGVRVYCGEPVAH